MAQSQTPLDIALRHIEQNYKSWDLSQADIADLTLSDSHISSNSGIAHLYFQQRYNGINIYNAILNVAVSSDGEVIHTGKNVMTNIANKINTNSPTIDMETALLAGFTNLQLEAPASFVTKETRSNTEAVFSKEKFAKRDIAVKLIYARTVDKNLKLAWDLQIDPVGTFEGWQFQIDATSGEIINKIDKVLRCNHSQSLGHSHSATCSDNAVTEATKSIKISDALASTNGSVVNNSYRVFGLPTESPIHGPHALVTNPEDMTASPLGWHDNGTNQWTITRGNNTHALLNLDGDANNTPDQPEPDGGATLDFDFTYNPLGEPTESADAAQVNLFYMANVMHDFTYLYGFDEAAGNFQDNNFGNGGAGNDPLIMNAQYGSTTGSLDNAFYSGAPDGSSPFVAMFVWAANNGAGLLTVTAPSSVEATYTTTTANFGPEVTTDPICGEVVIVNDGVYNPLNTDGCEEDFINGADLDGKIALIDRSGCFFQDKTLNAEAYGAIAVIICTFDENLITMGAGGTGSDPGIPTVMIGATDCQTIRQFAGNGLEACLQEPIQTGPELTDGDFDNGIIAHEIGHGISNRMTGGANANGCLSNAEQMGEGWSDWFGIVATVKPGDTGTTERGVGNYAVKLPADGGGIRRYPYSTDMNVNPLTYADVALNAEVHALGEVWCAMIWDLYWEMSDVHGWDEDLYYGTGGNNMAIRLVMEGMKLQPCNPGFVSGRDAILAADMAIYNGENQCLIWDVFARRGCGFYADEGDTGSAGDQTENFDSRPTCLEELKIKKTVSDFLEAGEEIEVTVTVTNHVPNPVVRTGVVVTDELADGLSYVAGSISSNITDVTQNGNMMTFTIGDINYLDEVVFTYKLETASDVFSIRKDFDDVEYDLDGALDWWITNIVTAADNQFELSENDPYAGEQCWFVGNEALESQHQLIGTKAFAINGDRPVMRFYTQYETEAGADGGLFEVSTDNGNTYQQLGEDMIRNGYPNGIQYGTFVVPNLSAFSGLSDGYEATYVDMSDYIGQTVKFRFHFASDDNTAPNTGGWWIDNIEYMDMISYNTEVCVTSEDGDNACTFATEEGTIIESQVTVSVSDPEASVQMGVYPNPASDLVNVTIASKQAQKVDLSIVTLDGKTVRSQSIGTTQNTQTFSLDVADLPAGFYLIKAATNNDVIVEKVVIK